MKGPGATAAKGKKKKKKVISKEKGPSCVPLKTDPKEHNKLY